MAKIQLLQSDFINRFLDANATLKRELAEWLFHPGMLFKSMHKWWGGGGRRMLPHEGVDFCFYRTKSGFVKYLDIDCRVPVLMEGTVAMVGDDYLGRSVFIRHDFFNSRGQQLYSAFGHMDPGEGILPGNTLGRTDIIGPLAYAHREDAAVLPHLHVSAMFLDESIKGEDITWQSISQSEASIFLNPLDIIQCKYSIVETDEYPVL